MSTSVTLEEMSGDHQSNWDSPSEHHTYLHHICTEFHGDSCNSLYKMLRWDSKHYHPYRHTANDCNCIYESACTVNVASLLLFLFWHFHSRSDVGVGYWADFWKVCIVRAQKTLLYFSHKDVLTGWGESLYPGKELMKSAAVNGWFVSLSLFKCKTMRMIHYFTWMKQSRFIVTHYRVTLRCTVILFTSDATCFQGILQPQLSAVTSITACVYFPHKGEKSTLGLCK